MNVAYQYSDDGGKTFKSSNAPHGDHHDLWIAPEDNNRLIIGDDGGAQVSYDKVKHGVLITTNLLLSTTELQLTIHFLTEFM